VRVARPKKRTLVAAVSVVSVLAVVFAVVVGPTVRGEQPIGSASADSELTGDELAAELGLSKSPDMPDDCNDFVQVGNPAGYCLDSLPNDDRERYRIARLLRDMPVTDLDVEIHAVLLEFSESPSDSDRHDELLAQLIALMKQRGEVES
jgi:hypothetical protein